MSKFDNQVNVVLAADDNYAMQLAVTMFSILRNLNKMSCLQLFILDGGISSKNKNKIKRLFKNNNHQKNHSINWIKPDLEKLNNLPTKGKPRAIYLPLLIPEYLPDQCNKVIFLDSDLILESDITGLYKHDVEKTPLWAVRDLLIQTLSGKDGIKSYKEIGTEKSPYFNSGVMLINLDYWRREKVTSRAIDYIQEYKEETRFHDQEALNAALADNWSKLDLRWNQQGCIYWPQVLPESDFTRTTLEKYDELVNAPYIVHFLSQSKPWNSKCMHPLTHRFIYYLKESQWFTKTEWMKWWYKYYYSRFKWLLGDLNETLNMVKIK